MVVREGEVTKVETLTEFMAELDSSYKEIINSHGEAGELLSEFNTHIREDHPDEDRADFLYDVWDDFFEYWISQMDESDVQMIATVLEERDRGVRPLVRAPDPHNR